MKANPLIFLLFSLPAVLAASTISYSNEVFAVSTNSAGFGMSLNDPCVGTTSCGSGGAQASANIDSVFNLPFAEVELNSICRLSDGECTHAVGSASFSVDFTVTGGGTTQGLIELNIVDSAQTGVFVGGFYNVGLPYAGVGPHGVSQYEFTYGTPFTVSGGLSGGCTECMIGGDVTVLSAFISDVPEPSAWLLAATGLLGIIARRVKMTFVS